MNRSRPVRLSELAREQVREADTWWRGHRSKAPNAIREELERASELIAFQPGIGTRARNFRLPGVRRFHLERIHYDIYYRVVGSPDFIENSMRPTPLYR